MAGYRAAIAIGIGAAEGFAALPGALAGADAFTAWATAARIDSVQQFDDRAAKVRLADIADAVDALIARADVEQLFVYFAGHGLALGTQEDFWILSAGTRRPSEVVALHGSLRIARHAGIPHVIVFSDACRTVPPTSQVDAALSGTSIFAPGAPTDPATIDAFYASRPGAPAQELSGHGLYTSVLVNALQGKANLGRVDPGAGSKVICADDLDRYLREAVPLEADRLRLQVQFPWATTESEFPAFIAQAAAPVSFAFTVDAELTGGLPPEAAREVAVEIFAIDPGTMDPRSIRKAKGIPHTATLPRFGTYGVSLSLPGVDQEPPAPEPYKILRGDSTARVVLRPSLAHAAPEEPAAMAGGGEAAEAAPAVPVPALPMTDGSEMADPAEEADRGFAMADGGETADLEAAADEGFAMADGGETADREPAAPPDFTAADIGTVTPAASPETKLALLEVSVVDEAGRLAPSAPTAGWFTVLTEDLVSGRVISEDRLLAAGEEPYPSAALLPDPSVAERMRRVEAVRWRAHYETATGLTVNGARVYNAYVRGGHEGLFKEEGAWNVRYRTDISSAVLALGYGRYAGLAMFPGFIGEVLVGPFGVENLCYTPAGGPFGADDDEQRDARRRILAVLQVAARGGRFGLALDGRLEGTLLLSRGPVIDPVWGVLAAYAARLSQDENTLTTLVEEFTSRGQPVPFDVAFLALGEGWRTIPAVVPSFPLLTATWELLGEDSTLPPVVAKARKKLAPTLWTTILGHAGRKLGQAIKSGELP